MQAQKIEFETPGTSIVRPDADLADLIPGFMQNRHNEMVQLQAAVTGHDFKFISRMMHTWKGIARPYGFIHLELLSVTMEQAAKSSDHAMCVSLCGEIKEHLNTVVVIFED